jgi:hypothetical protein
VSGDSGEESIDQNEPAPSSKRVRIGVEARERLVRVACPRRGERAREVVLLGDEVERAVAHPAWLDEHDLCRVGEHVGEQSVLVDEPRQPALHAVEVGALGQTLPLFAAPRLARDELAGAVADVVARHQLASREDVHLVEVVGRALVVDAEAGQPVDLVAPQVDADGGVGGRREHVDDRTAPGEFPAVLHQLLAPVAELDQAAAQRVGIDLAAGTHDDRLGGRRAGAELLHQRPDAGDDHPRAPLGVAQAPQDVETLTHRLDARADPLERQRLPPGEVHHVARWEELGEVVGELARHRAGRAAHDERSPRRQRRERGDRDRPRHLHDRQPRLGVAERTRQTRLVAQQRRQRAHVGVHCGTTPPAPTPPSPKNASFVALSATIQADFGRGETARRHCLPL